MSWHILGYRKLHIILIGIICALFKGTANICSAHDFGKYLFVFSMLTENPLQATAKIKKPLWGAYRVGLYFLG